MFSILLMLVGFVFLIKGADFLVEGATALARKYEVSDLVIGLTVVAFGTSLPELFVNLFAVVEKNVEIAIGNVIGSNVANILLILGTSAVIYPLAVSRGTVWREIPFSLFAAILLGILANDRYMYGSGASVLSRIDGLIFLTFFIIFLLYSFRIAKKINGMNGYVPHTRMPNSKAILWILLGLIGLALGGKWIVEGAVYLASLLGASQSLVGLTIVAIGTSLPELATSAVAAFKKNVEIAVGNVVGSNIFNIFMVLGISSTIRPIPFQPRDNTDIGVIIIASLIFFCCMFLGKKHILGRWKGLMFLMFYVVYIIFIIYRG